jgi:hypothetical protein
MAPHRRTFNMRAVRKRLTYANVTATLALFLALSGGVVWASGKIGTSRLKSGAVTAGKIKHNAVIASKIKANAVTGTKLKNGAVSFAKLGAGSNLVLTATSPPLSASETTPLNVPLSGPTSFTPQTGTLNLLSVEVRGNSLQRVGAAPCEPSVVPFVNGSEWDFAGGGLTVSAFAPTPEQPTGLAPIASATGPVGLTSPGVPQALGAKVFGDPRCKPGSSVTVAVAVTQAK